MAPKLVYIVALCCITPYEALPYNGTYILTAPKMLIKGHPYHASVSILQPIARLQLEIRPVRNTNGPLAIETLRNLRPGQNYKINLFPDTSVDSSYYIIHAKGFDQQNRTIFDQQERVDVIPDVESIFIQTDKAKYKPGTKLRYRVVVVSGELKPVRGRTISVKIKDPKRNVITQLLNQTLNKGVFSSEMELSHEPPLGEWTIAVESSSGKQMEKNFMVEKYVLPKFDVQVETSSGDSALITDSISATIKAKYTFGKGVAGRASVTASAVYSNRRPRPRRSIPLRSYFPPPDRSLSKDIKLNQNGEAVVVFSNAELRGVNLMSNGLALNISAVVTEELTSEQQEGFTLVKLHKDPVIIIFHKPTGRFVPGMDYQFSVFLITYDGKSLPVDFPRNINVMTTFTYKYGTSPVEESSFPVEESSLRVRVPFLSSRPVPLPPLFPQKTTMDSQNLTLDRNGEKNIKIRPPINVERVQIRVEYELHDQNVDQPTVVAKVDHLLAAQSPSNSFLTLMQKSESVVPGHRALFKVFSTEPIGSLAMLVVSKGKILASLDYQMGDTMTAMVSLDTTQEMSPRATVIVYKMREENKEIIAHSAQLYFARSPRNQVQVSMSPREARPGQSVTVRVRSNPNSFVGLMAVDKSVKILKSGNDITPDLVEQAIDQSTLTGPLVHEGITAYTVFYNANVLVLTDASLYIPPPPLPSLPVRFAGIRPPVQPAPSRAIQPDASPVAAGGDAKGGATRTRSAFPETWIWFDSVTKADGETILRTTAPDTITTWLTTAFAINDDLGLGVTPEPVELEVFQPFFVRANLPYSVKRGEQLGLQVLVFNYQPTAQQVTVTLTHDATSGFDFVAQNGAKIKAGRGSPGYNVRTVRVGGINGTSPADVFFPIVPTAIGTVKLTIQADGTNVADRIEKDLLVEPEGYLVEINKPLTIDLTSKQLFRDVVSIPIPQDIVPDSDRAEVSVTGTVLGPAAQNLKSLVRMPSGCGEQNMIGFVPNIVVLRYLEASRQLQPTLRDEAIRNMKIGYQRELNFKRDDGSYSAFGERDPSGSTWLTAFVMKSFAQAKESVFIDDEVMKQGLQFLKEKQRSNGQFAEDGKVVHGSEIQGGVSSGVPLTAFVLIALLRNQLQNLRAQALLEQSLDTMTNDTYALSITTYALHMANSPMKEKAMQLMERTATLQDGTKFWKDRAEEAEYDEDRPPYWTQPSSTHVESTGYALLTYMLRNDMISAMPVVRWLTKQMNPNGGFTSTQDTVIALQGLGAYAEKAYSGNLSVDVEFKSGSASTADHFLVNAANAVVQQKKDISNARQPVSFHATGTGMVTAQLTVRYNSKMRKQNDPFECSPTVTPKSLNDITISMCCRHKKLGKTKMAVMEVNALSGYNIDEEKLQSLTSIQDLQRVELERGNSKANIYFNSLGPHPTCFNVSSSKSFDVASPKPARMSLYAYYAPEKRIEMEYSATSSQPLYQSCPRCWENARISQIETPGRWLPPQRQTQWTNQPWWQSQRN